MAGSVASQVILFVAMIGITTGLVVVFNEYVDETSSSTTAQWKIISDQMKTDITITSITYNSLDNPDNITFYLMNTGKTILNQSLIDVYLDGFVSRNVGNRTIELDSSTDNIDSNVWNPKEVVKVVVFRDLNPVSTYSLCITSEYGTKSCDSFST